MTDPTSRCEPNEFLSKALLADTIAIDTETNGEDVRDGRGFCIGISGAVHLDSTYYTAYFPVAHTKYNVDERTKELLFQVISTRAKVVMHNAKFDLISLKTAGFSGKMLKWYCTMLMAHMLNENIPKSLDWLARNELKEPGKHKPPEWELMFSLYGWSPKFPASIMALYATEDAVLDLKLFEKLYPIFVDWDFDGS